MGQIKALFQNLPGGGDAEGIHKNRLQDSRSPDGL
jgi:hypothetical protein